MKGHVLGVRVDAGRLESAAEDILATAGARAHAYVCVANVHMVVTATDDPRLREAMEEAAFVVSDGMPLVWVLRRQGLRAERIPGTDLTLRLCREAERDGLPVYFYGGTEATAARLRSAIERAFPSLTIAGCEAPPVLPEDPPFDAATAERIRASGARLLFVGLGCPKQELWMARHVDTLPMVQLGVGAAFDFIAGNKKRAPRWARDMGLEWLHRLASEPRRLWRRYLTTNVGFAVGLTRERLRRR